MVIDLIYNSVLKCLCLYNKLMYFFKINKSIYDILKIQHRKIFHK